MKENRSSQNPVVPTAGPSTRRVLSLRTRLLIAFALLTVVPALILGSVAALISSQGLRAAALDELQSVATLKGNEIRDWLQVLQTNLPLVFEDQQLEQGVHALLRDNQSNVVNPSVLRGELTHFKDGTGYFEELFVLNREGEIVLSTNSTQEGKIQKNQNFFQQGLTDQFVSPPIYEVSLGNYSITLSQPIRAESGEVIGVLTARANISRLSDIMQQATGLGETGETYLVSSNFAALTTIKNTDFELGKTYVRTEGVTSAIESKSAGSGTYTDFVGDPTLGVYQWVPELQVAIIAEHKQETALAAANRVLQVSILLMLLTSVVALSIAVLFTRSIINPISQLVTSAETIASGNLDINAPVHSQDEIGILANAFNTMTGRLRELVGTLEQRIADRTRALAASNEVSRRLSSLLDQKQLVEDVVNQVRNAFGYYHTQIYFFDANNENLVMAGGTGEAGKMMLEQFHKVRKGNGLVGRAAANNELIFVSDTLQNPEWLPNPLLPDTRAEIAIPISIGDEVLGVLDIQHNIPNGLNQEDIDALASIANQVAVAVQNSRSYTEIQRSQALLSEALSISRLANWEYDVEQDIFTFNDQFYSIFHTNVEKVGGYKLSSADYARLFVHPEDAPLVGAEIQKVLTSNERHISTAVEHRTIYPDGEIGYISVRVSVERDENGKVVRWSGANQDITERRNLEEINRKRAVQQEAINKITQRIQSAATIEEAMQVAARELGHALGERQTLVTLEPSALGGNGKEE